MEELIDDLIITLLILLLIFPLALFICSPSVPVTNQLTLENNESESTSHIKEDIFNNMIIQSFSMQ